MKNQFLISEEEKIRILSIHETATKKQYLNLITEESVYNQKTEAIQKKLKFLRYNPGVIDGKYGKNTACAVAAFQAANNLVIDGKVGKNTAEKLGGVLPYYPKDVDINISINKGCSTQKGGNEPQKPNSPINNPDSTWGPDKPKSPITNNPCVSIPPEFCDKVSSQVEVNIGNGGSEGCSEFVGNFLKIGPIGDAWKAFNNVKKYGVKYNMFTDGQINWDNIRNSIKSNGINSQTCGCFIEEGLDKDKSCSNGQKISKTISSFYPSSSNLSISNLKLGDIVGMYWKNSSNKGKAFCSRAVTRGLGPDGSVKDNDPFTFNTHLGYVGAIKNGAPIIFHSVHGKRLATPANELLSSSGNGMITWVTGGPNTESKDDSKEDSIWDNFLKFSKK
jgi:hypothetical protein